MRHGSLGTRSFPGAPASCDAARQWPRADVLGDEDYALYRDLLGQHCAAADVEIWSWVLMPNHVHLILVPGDADGLRRALSAVHRRYAGHIHARLKRTGHFWQGRFGWVAMDEAHLGAALRYVSLNPVRRGWRRAQRIGAGRAFMRSLGRLDDGITNRDPVLSRYPDFAALLAAAEDEELSLRLRKAERIGRPIGDAAFLDRLERDSGRVLKPARRGRKVAKSAVSP